MLGIFGCFPQAADIPLATVVRFNTLCATCHEGECSGRLSFDLGIQAAENHIRRHAGDVDRDVWRDLARLLAHTKQACAYYPMAVDIPKIGTGTRNVWPNFTMRGKTPGSSRLATCLPAAIVQLLA